MGGAAILSDTQARLQRASAALGPTVATLTLPRRALILAETLERPISPSQFASEWGLEATATYGLFRRMEKDGFLEKFEKARGRLAGDGSRRGRPVQLYCASRNLIYRTDEWQHLPLDVREGHSFVVFITLMSRISLSINAGTLDRDLDRHFTWKALELDRATWAELILRLDEVLDWAIEAEVESKQRQDASGEELIPATIALAGFRSPSREDLQREGQALFREQLSRDPALDTERSLHAANRLQSKAAGLTIPERALILAETLERPLSPSQFAHEWNLEKEATARHFRRMEEAGFLTRVDKAPPRVAGGSGRGRKAQRYRATQSLLYWTGDWKDLPRDVREGHTFVVFVTLMSRISLALSARTMDAEIDRHFTWKALELDRVSWTELMFRLDEVLDWIIGAEKLAKTRHADTGEILIPSTVALGGFRSPARSELLLQATA